MEEVEIARNVYLKSAMDTLVDAFNTGYDLGVQAAKQIYK